MSYSVEAGFRSPDDCLLQGMHLSSYPIAVKSMKDVAVRLEFWWAYLASFSNEIADVILVTEMIKVTP